MNGLRGIDRLRPTRMPVVWLVLGCCLVSFFLTPVPGRNEPHYLAKARHFWQPDWCAGDPFLESANAHTVFYALFGGPAAWFGLPPTAVFGRIAGFILLATGWMRLGSALRLPVAVSLFAALLFQSLQLVGNFSGEWVVHGIESKVLTYGCLLWAWAECAAGHYRRAGLFQGLAIAFHPVVGLWGLLAAAGSLGWLLLRRRVDLRSDRATSIRIATALVLLALAAAPGMLPVLELLREEASPLTRYSANYLQVFFRLAHHLDPMRFSWRAYVGYAALALGWGIGWWQLVRQRQRQIKTVDANEAAAVASCEQPACDQPASDQPVRAVSVDWLLGIVGWSVIFAVVGILIGYGPRPADQMPGYSWRMSLLKFYPFRLADALLPAAVAWLIAAGWCARLPSRHQLWPAMLLFCSVFGWQAYETNRSTVSPDAHADWLAACDWFRTETPADILVQTPRGRFTFKWFAERPEYVCYKDCPQDAAGIVEWNRRLNFLSKWYQDHFDDQQYTREELQELSRETGITHLLTDRLGPMTFPPVYQNRSYRVYDLRPPVSAPAD